MAPEAAPSADRDLGMSLSRRRLLGLSSAVAALAVAGPLTPAAAATSAASGVTAAAVALERTTRPTRAARRSPTRVGAAASRDTVLHLLRRTTYGPTPALVAEVTSRGPGSWLERQLHPGSIPDPQGEAIRSLYPEAGWTVAQVNTAVKAGRVERFSWDVMQALGQYTLAMATWSSRQLFEVMVEFWSNHLNVANPSDGAWDNRQDYDRRVIRAHALGRFSDMLAASAAHPAMLEYLNQAESTKEAPNENYGRELLELHTVGVDAGYTEAMVLDSARIMTGYTIQWDDRSPKLREFRYDPSIHWTGKVHVLGFTHRNAAANGRAVVDDVPRLPGAPPGHRANHRTQARRAVRVRQPVVGPRRPPGLHVPRPRHRHRPGPAHPLRLAGVP